ncbi:glucosamine-6-phosphate deaminase [Planctomycetes bacterium K23_9]|uniref:Glucosamine-6-phosphate deaminase 1 n=1 Tax=Stieleria marina TaxID=1930275 RepID=A0A517NPU9_9BACT|nr:Glucosamine-6-phosphate deaminase 1 [Planctomycetes bacterium K23_9]
MHTILTADSESMGRVAANLAAKALKEAIEERGQANLIVATGASQFEVLGHLVAAEGIDWSKVHGFHLDEYVGLSIEHPASFCRYLKERFVDHVNLAAFHYLSGDKDPQKTIASVGVILSKTAIDVALVGIGENGHLAFNDPPADFETEEPYLIVELDLPCREQQVGEGWFASLTDVPTHAISMSIRQIMKTASIICSVPDRRKADAVKATLEGDVCPEVPASILNDHAATTLVIDLAAASKLSASTRNQIEEL